MVEVDADSDDEAWKEISAQYNVKYGISEKSIKSLYKCVGRKKTLI